MAAGTSETSDGKKRTPYGKGEGGGYRAAPKGTFPGVYQQAAVATTEKENIAREVVTESELVDMSDGEKLDLLVKMENLSLQESWVPHRTLRQLYSVQRTQQRTNASINQLLKIFNVRYLINL